MHFWKSKLRAPLQIFIFLYFVIVKRLSTVRISAVCEVQIITLGFICHGGHSLQQVYDQAW